MSGSIETGAYWTTDHKDPICICKRYYEPGFLTAMLPWFNTLFNEYFRTQLYGIENIPTRADDAPPLIFICNHAGLTLPWDMMMTEFALSEIYEGKNIPFYRRVRTLAAPVLSETPQMRLFCLPGIWRQLGVIDASYRNFDRMMNHSWDLLLCPEGIDGIAKNFRHRYQLQEFSPAYLRMALKYGATIVPISIVNSEYFSPYGFRIGAIDWVANKIFKMPFYPISPLALLGAVFPFAAYSVLPAQLSIVFGKPITVGSLEKTNRPSQSFITALNQDIRQLMQNQLTQASKDFGAEHYKLWQFGTTLWNNKKRVPSILPVGWSSTVLKVWNRHRRQEGRKAMSSFVLALRIVCYFIPIVGWLLLIFFGVNDTRRLPRVSTS